jgi:hypothetical protein
VANADVTRVRDGKDIANRTLNGTGMGDEEEEKEEVEEEYSIECHARYFLTRDHRLLTDGDARAGTGDLTLGHLRTQGRERCSQNRLGCLGPWCPAFEAPAHGQVVPASIVLTNATVQVICDPYYEIAGTGTRMTSGTRFGESVCMPDGSYDPMLACDGPWCTPLVAPENAISFPATRMRVGENVHVVCKMGYSHWGDGSKHPQCLAAPYTYETPQACYRSCGVHPPVLHASVWPQVRAHALCVLTPHNPADSMRQNVASVCNSQRSHALV